MSVHVSNVERTLTCNEYTDNVPCRRVFVQSGTAAQVRALAKLAGWSVSRPGGHDYCPDHRSGVLVNPT